MAEEATCLFCHVTKVPIRDWNKRCASCREKKKTVEQNVNIQIGKQQAAAVITLDNGQQVLVDKFGHEVSDAGYDLKHDPRGWRKTGTLPPKRETIL